MRVGFFCIQEVTGFSARLQLYLQAFPLVGHRFADLAGSLVAYTHALTHKHQAEGAFLQHAGTRRKVRFFSMPGNWPSRSAMVRVLSLSDHVKRMVEQMPFS